jgi:hypothetical protein
MWREEFQFKATQSQRLRRVAFSFSPDRFGGRPLNAFYSRATLADTGGGATFSSAKRWR